MALMARACCRSLAITSIRPMRNYIRSSTTLAKPDTGSTRDVTLQACPRGSRMLRQERHDRLDDARRNRQRRIAVGREIGGRVCGRDLQDVIDALERHHGDAG